MRLRTEPDCYGASKLISKALCLPFTPRSICNWQHGWLYGANYSQQFGIKNNYKYLVANKHHELFLLEKGFDAVAVAHPFIYASCLDTASSNRINNSLLFMPPHTLSHTKLEWNEHDVLNELIQVAQSFSFVMACIHPSCIQKNLWLNSLKKVGIPYIQGASMDDSNSLIRMSRLFRSFEYMATCSIGSHLAYASYSGCKVFFLDSYLEYKSSFLATDDLYKAYPELLDYQVWITSEAYVKKEYPFFFNNPKHLSSKIDWASNELGLPNMLSVCKLAETLGWRVLPQLKDLQDRAVSRTNRILTQLNNTY